MSHPDYREPRDVGELAAAIHLFLTQEFGYRVVAAAEGGVVVMLAGCGFGDAAVVVSDPGRGPGTGGGRAWGSIPRRTEITGHGPPIDRRPGPRHPAASQPPRGGAMRRDGNLNGEGRGLPPIDPADPDLADLVEAVVAADRERLRAFRARLIEAVGSIAGVEEFAAFCFGDGRCEIEIPFAIGHGDDDLAPQIRIKVDLAE